MLNPPFVIAGAVVLMIVSHWLEKRRNREIARRIRNMPVPQMFELVHMHTTSTAIANCISIVFIRG